MQSKTYARIGASLMMAREHCWKMQLKNWVYLHAGSDRILSILWRRSQILNGRMQKLVFPCGSRSKQFNTDDRGCSEDFGTNE
jgi:hypothetical protein